MSYNKPFMIIGFILMLAMIIGCSGSPVSLDKESGTLDNIPVIGLSEVGDTFNAIGLLGAYELNINAETMTADLVTKRMGSAIGDSFVISGLPFFTITPCQGCLKLTTVKLTPDGDLALSFSLQHPFEPGNLSLPPKANNRLDLDIFDVAAVIVPIGGTATATEFATLGKIYDGICADASGYTKELANLFTPANTAAMPFFLVVDDSIDETPPVSTYNEFPMGGNDEFDVVFNLIAGEPTMKFDLYLTFGYGAAAKGSDKPSFLAPKYFNPEFNRKNAWKVVVTPPTESWKDNEPTVEKNVEVKVWDWQQGATVSTTVPYSIETVLTKVFEVSNVTKVQAEIFGDTGETLVGTGLGTPASPLIYQVPIANSLSRPSGAYTGIVKVTDSRTPALAFTEGNDFLIDTPDGMDLNNVLMTEFATYQTFEATVEPLSPITAWSENFDVAPAGWFYEDYRLYGGGCFSAHPGWIDVGGPFGPSGAGGIRFSGVEDGGRNVLTVVSTPFAVPTATGYSEVVLRVYLASDFSNGIAFHSGMNFKIASSSTPGLAPFIDTGALGTTTVLTSTDSHGSTFPAMGMCGFWPSQMRDQAGWDGSGQNDLPPSLTQYVDLVIPPTFYGQTVKVAFQWSQDDCFVLADNSGFALDDYSLIAYP